MELCSNIIMEREGELFKSLSLSYSNQSLTILWTLNKVVEYLEYLFALGIFGQSVGCFQWIHSQVSAVVTKYPDERI